MLWERHIIAKDIRKRSIAVLALEWCGAVQHLVDQDPESPPVHCTCVTAPFDDLRCDIFLRPNEGVCSKVCYTRFRVDRREGVRVRTVAA